MAVIENRVTEEGDVLIIKPEVPVVGLISLSQFVDTTQNESETDYFKKEFRYSVDAGLTFSSWIELNLINIQNVSITAFNQFVIEYRYTRVGNAPEVELEFDDILVSGEVTDLPYPVYKKTFFNRFFNVNDVNVFGWALNVLEKLYAKGLILPDYIQRGDNNSNLEDEDFIAYWFSITHYFAIIVYMARHFENIANNPELIVNFLKSRGIYFSENLDAEELSLIFANWPEQFSKRGTSSVYERKGENITMNGELLRMLNNSESDEFIFTNLSNFETGWCVGKSSPMWSKTLSSINLKKDFVLGETFELLPKINPDYVFETETAGELFIDESPVFAGLGYDGVNKDNYIRVSEKLGYEVTFFVRFTTINSELRCSVNCFDVNGNNTNTRRITDGAISSFFGNDFVGKNTEFDYFVRLIIFPLIQPLNPDDFNSLNGWNLKFNSVTSRIIPNILIKGSAIVKDVKVKPLKYNFTQGQLGMREVYLLIGENKSQLIDKVVENIISENLISYNNFLKPNWL